MQIFRHLIIGALILYLVAPEVEGGWFKKLWKKVKKGVKKVGKGIGKAAKGIWRGVKKVGCKALFGIVCPAGVGTVGGIIGAGTSGVGAALVGAGVAAGVQACHVRKNRCKRSADDSMQGLQFYPFSDDFTDYDINDDKLIEYEELVFAVMREFPMAQPEELREPFIWADANGDDRLDMDEFMGAPFMFAHYEPEVAASA